MEKNVVAKNLLEGKNCQSCEYGVGSGNYCTSPDPTTIQYSPKEKTCEYWKKIGYYKETYNVDKNNS